MWIDFEKTKLGELRSPSMVVAVSTSLPQYKALYSQARELADYMLKNIEFKKIGTLRSSALPPEVLVREGGISTLPECHFYLSRGKKDLVLFSGDSSPMDGQYEFAQILLSYAKELGVAELYSVGARWAENPLSPEAEPEPNGFATDSLGVSKLKKHGVKVVADEPAPFFASMVVGMAKEYGIRAYKLAVDHGEPSPHTKSVAKLLGVISTMAGFEVPLDGLKSALKGTSQPKAFGDSTIYQ